MRYIVVLLFCVGLLSACSSNPVPKLEAQVLTGWHNLGGTVQDPWEDMLDYSEMAVYQGIPTVAYTSCSWPCALGSVAVKRWNPKSASWAKLGGNLELLGEDARFSSITLDAQGNPYVAFAQCFSSEALICDYYELIIKHWNGSAWQQLSIPIAILKGLDTLSPPLTKLLFYQNALYVLHVNSSLQLTKWDGNTWSLVGPAMSNNAFQAYPYQFFLSMNSFAKPVVAWTAMMQQTSNSYVKVLEGNSWQDLTPALSNTQLLSLNLSAKNLPVLTTANPRLPTTHFIRYWDGQGWQTFGDRKTKGKVVGLSATSQPIVLEDTALLSWNGSSWQSQTLSPASLTAPNDTIKQTGALFTGTMLLASYEECRQLECQLDKSTFIKRYFNLIPFTQGPGPISFNP